MSRPQKGTIAREAGDDYKTEELPVVVQDGTAGQGIDRIIEVDLATNLGVDIALLCPDGEVIVHGSGAPDISVPFSTAIRKGIHMHFFIIYNLNRVARERAIADLSTLLEGSHLKHNIAARLPLAQIAEAHDLVDRGQVNGNIVLEVRREIRLRRYAKRPPREISENTCESSKLSDRQPAIYNRNSPNWARCRLKQHQMAESKLGNVLVFFHALTYVIYSCVLCHKFVTNN